VLSWLKSAGRFRVESMPMPHPGRRVDMDASRVGVMHTIEGSLESGLAVFRQHFAPHFTVGRDRNGRLRVLQHIPLGFMAAALKNLPGGVETNFEAEVQIELAGHSSTSPWLPDSGVTVALASLMATLNRTVGIPLSRPFPDRMPPLPWATSSFPRRHAGRWGLVSGWYGHVEVPENNHWDPGALRWSPLLRMARGVSAGLAPISEADWEFGRWYLGLREFAQFGPQHRPNRPRGYPAKVGPNGWRAVKWYVKNLNRAPSKLDALRTLPLKRAAAKAAPAPLCACVGP